MRKSRERERQQEWPSLYYPGEVYIRLSWRGLGRQRKRSLPPRSRAQSARTDLGYCVPLCLCFPMSFQHLLHSVSERALDRVLLHLLCMQKALKFALSFSNWGSNGSNPVQSHFIHLAGEAEDKSAPTKEHCGMLFSMLALGLTHNGTQSSGKRKAENRNLVSQSKSVSHLLSSQTTR